MSTLFLVVAVLSALWGLVDFILIAVSLERRGIPVNMVLARVFFFRYLKQYKDVTTSETGKAGPLYTSYIAAMNIALVCTVIGLMLRAR
jgi:hypothetical protein